MGHGKETPRQKMIGMMYLVLTALLALNVSKDVLNAFVLVDDGLMKTIEIFSQKNRTVYDAFREQYMLNEAKVGKWYDHAKEVEQKSNELYDHMHQLKVKILETGKETAALADETLPSTLIKGKDNADIPAQIMIRNGEAKVLRKMIEDYRDFLLQLAVGNEGLTETLKKNLDTKDPPPKEGKTPTWEIEHFENLPLIAVITILSGFQTNVRNAESDIINYLIGQIDAGSFKFNKLEPIVTFNSNYVLRGGEYNARVFLAAFDTTQAPEVYVGNVETYTENGITRHRMVGQYETLDVDDFGRAIYRKPASAVRNFTWGGLIRLKNSDGSFTEKTFNAEYQVAEGSVVVSPTKMNVFYVGVDNPVEISIPGVPGDKISAEITNATISTRAPFIVIPRRPGNAMLTVYATLDGRRQKMGEKEFRVKMVPNPEAKVGGRKGGAIAKNMLLAQSGVEAAMENFDFDLQFRVTEFTVSAVIRGFVSSVPVKSNTFSQEQRELIGKLDRGSKVYIEDIKAVGPDGVPRDLSTVTFIIN